MLQTKSDNDTIDERPLATERRRSPRFRLQDGALATATGILGPILDLSMQGMSFEYYADDLKDTDPVMNIGIFISGNKTLLTGLHGKIVRDQPIVGRNSFLPTLQKKRAVEFIDLTPEQRNDLHEILKTEGIDLI